MRVLLTGRSGTGKSTLVQELRRRGHACPDRPSPAANLQRSRVDRGRLGGVRRHARLIRPPRRKREGERAAALRVRLGPDRPAVVLDDPPAPPEAAPAALLMTPPA